MANSQSQKVAKRQTAAQRLRAKRAEEEKILAAGFDAVEQAHLARAAAMEAAEAADEKFRAAVAAMVERKQSLEEIAEMAAVPLSDVRSARRAKRGETSDDDQGDRQVPHPDEGAGYGGLVGAQLRREAESSVALDREQTHVVGEPAAVAS